MSYRTCQVLNVKNVDALTTMVDLLSLVERRTITGFIKFIDGSFDLCCFIKLAGEDKNHIISGYFPAGTKLEDEFVGEEALVKVKGDGISESIDHFSKKNLPLTPNVVIESGMYINFEL